MVGAPKVAENIMTHWLGLPALASAHGGQIDGMIGWVHVFMLIIVKLRSKDMIHSVGVPEFRVKQDAIPGLTIPIWFVPNVTTAEMRTRTGNPEFQYEIACAQLCGLGHAKMRGFVTVLSAEEFQKWMEDKVKEQSAPNPFR